MSAAKTSFSMDQYSHIYHSFQETPGEDNDNLSLEDAKPLETFGHIIRTLRHSKKLSLEEMAGKIHLGPKELDEIERGLVSADQVILHLQNIARVLGVKPKTLAVTLVNVCVKED